MNNASPLHFAAFAACPKLVGALLDAGCRGDHVNDHGGSALTNAAANPTTTPELLARLRKKGGAGFCLNCVARPRTRKWLLIDRAAETAYRHNLVPKTDLVTHLANSRGSTALHDAAKLGHISTVTWLLAHGAHESLWVRNRLGRTPLDLAHKFGPFPEVEALLGAAMINPRSAMMSDSKRVSKSTLRLGSLSRRGLTQRFSRANGQRPLWRSGAPEPGSPYSPASPASPLSPLSPLSPGPKTPGRELKAVKKQNLQLKTQLSALQKQSRAAQ